MFPFARVKILLDFLGELFVWVLIVDLVNRSLHFLDIFLDLLFLDPLLFKFDIELSLFVCLRPTESNVERYLHIGLRIRELKLPLLHKVLWILDNILRTLFLGFKLHPLNVHVSVLDLTLRKLFRFVILLDDSLALKVESKALYSVNCWVLKWVKLAWIWWHGVCKEYLLKLNDKF